MQAPSPLGQCQLSPAHKVSCTTGEETEFEKSKPFHMEQANLLCVPQGDHILPSLFLLDMRQAHLLKLFTLETSLKIF